MAYQGTSSRVEGLSSGPDSHPRQPSISPPTRSNTVSTVASDKHLPPGTWKIPIHGNCPRCHHHHKAFLIRVEVSGDPNEVTDILCEKCHQKWLAVGGGSSTQLSLLSTASTDLDHVEIDFRKTLIDMVREATGTATAAGLPGVPESSSRAPSRQASVNMHTQHPSRSASLSDAEPRPAHQIQPPEAILGGGATPTVVAPVDQRADRATLASERRRAGKTLATLKRKLQDAFPIFKESRFKRLSSPWRKALRQEKAKSKSPIAQNELIHYPSHSEARAGRGSAYEPKIRSNSTDKTEDAENGCLPKDTRSDAIEKAKNDEEKLKGMTPHQHDAWIRDHMTAFKCRCARQCTCRSHVSPDARAELARIEPFLTARPPRPELAGVGSHLTDFAPGAFYTDTGPLNISTTTRTSEADTAVSGRAATATANPQNSLLGLSPSQRPRSLSPRPASLRHSRYSLQRLRQHGLMARTSIDSNLTAGRVRSTSTTSRRGTERFSTASLGPPSMSLAPESLAEQSRTQQPTPGENEYSDLDNEPRASTPHINGYRTSDERNRESDTTQPADSFGT
ncbi:hypothetical protein BU26DRAFT_338998 [Trematosphaeria pertusa]|uniref:Uncharacterized protein n=1 Tax=Trematosphaeria pertusa TaxID=390896 RepID=A0A6A6I9R4_9PLEO|nr:uncharacterized protein BU26DRAFT_338998 [Trematosphaeria pertusa]KAF2246997.1 hypothetical protein BU26DRAFT_338998 [Trematosphaeria pertusa]